MSSLFSNIFRRKLWKFTERQSHQCPTQSFSPPNDYPDGGYKLYKRVALFLALPAVIAVGVMIYLKRKQHEEVRQPFVKYEYMRLRSKPFPWGDGDHSFFHNPKFNALPGGYEDEVCKEEDEGPSQE